MVKTKKSDFKEDLIQIGRNIKILRKSFGLKQIELEKHSNLSTKTISNIELGKHSCEVETYLKIANIFRIPLHILWTRPTDLIQIKQSLFDFNYDKFSYRDERIRKLISYYEKNSNEEEIKIKDYRNIFRVIKSILSSYNTYTTTYKKYKHLLDLGADLGARTLDPKLVCFGILYLKTFGTANNKFSDIQSSIK